MYELENEDVTEGMREIRRMCPNCWYCWSPLKAKGEMYCEKCEALRQTLFRISMKEAGFFQTKKIIAKPSTPDPVMRRNARDALALKTERTKTAQAILREEREEELRAQRKDRLKKIAAIRRRCMVRDIIDEEF